MNSRNQNPQFPKPLAKPPRMAALSPKGPAADPYDSFGQEWPGFVTILFYAA
jgi:hypothetical protein